MEKACALAGRVIESQPVSKAAQIAYLTHVNDAYNVINSAILALNSLSVYWSAINLISEELFTISKQISSSARPSRMRGVCLFVFSLDLGP